MKFIVAAARLAQLPAVVPDGPTALTPVRLSGTPWKPAADGMAGARPAAVLVLIAPDAAGDARVVLIQRTSYDGHHSGEIAFPGGASEAGDASLVETAIREATEETGLDPVAVGLRVIGELEPFWIPVSNFRVTPVIALADRLPDAWAPDAREVERVVEAPIASFLPDAEITVMERDVREWRIRYGAYALRELGDGPAVWGATARILGQLGAMLDG